MYPPRTFRHQRCGPWNGIHGPAMSANCGKSLERAFILAEERPDLLPEHFPFGAKENSY